MTKKKDNKESINFTSWEKGMKEILKKAKKTEKEFITLQMETNIKVNLKKT